MKDRDFEKTHKKHRNVLYTLVIIVAIIQISSFVILSAQITKISSDFEKEKKDVREELSQSFLEKIIEYNAVYQKEFNSINELLDEQGKTINSLSAEQTDFSRVVQETIKGVVGVVTNKGSGSGFIISDEGYIVTNEHVISGATAANIISYESKVYKVSLIGKNTKKDIALLKIESGDYQELKIGDSDNLKVGNKVIAIGNPLGLSFTVTEGIVSAVNRPGLSGEQDYIQTDVSLNPGNSGGPLINTQGEVVGINNFKIGNGAEGLGFALEGNIVKDIVNDIANKTIV